MSHLMFMFAALPRQLGLPKRRVKVSIFQFEVANKAELDYRLQTINSLLPSQGRSKQALNRWRACPRLRSCRPEFAHSSPGPPQFCLSGKTDGPLNPTRRDSNKQNQNDKNVSYSTKELQRGTLHEDSQIVPTIFRLKFLLLIKF